MQRRRPELKFNHFIAVLVTKQLFILASPPTAQAFRSQQQSHQLQSSHSNGIRDNAGGSSNPDKEKHVRTMDINAVEARMLSLPCPISAPLEDVYMVLWFRDNAGIPFYRISNVMIKEKPDAKLSIQFVGDNLAGTTNYPESMVPNGTELGPKQEGDYIVITCRVVGGRPQSQVRWLVNGFLVDNENEHNSGDVIENRLLWPSVQRNNFHSVFTRQAVNTDLVKPKERSFILDRRYPPLVSLRLGSTLTLNDIKKDDDVYFECHVQSNPP